jgi:glycosyltransferase involved in cell wall biosynthesis
VDSIFVVDDCSPDNTSDVVKKVKRTGLNLIKNKENLGVGGAVKNGFRSILKTDADIVVKMDGDGQMDPRYIKHLLDKIIIDDFDYAKGNRFYSSNSFSGMPIFRLFGNIVLSLMTKVSSGYWDIIDPQNGFVAVKSDILRLINIEKLDDGYFFENSMLVELNILKSKVVDVPIPAKYEDEESKLKIPKIVIPFLWNLTVSFSRRIFQKYFLRGIHPVFLFLLFGSILFLFGLIFGIVHYIDSVSTGIVATTGTVMIAVLPLLMGFELILWAVVLDIQNKD